MIWICPRCGRKDEVTFTVLDVRPQAGRPHADYADDGFKWPDHTYEVEWDCGPCEDGNA